MPIVFIGMPIILLFIILFVLRNIVWKNSKKVFNELNNSDFEIFDNIYLQITRYTILSLIVGIPFKAQLLINNSQLILLLRKKPILFDINLNLPLKLSNSKRKEDYEIKILSMNKISILVKPHPKEPIKIYQKIYIKPKDRDDFEKLKVILINWC